MLKRPLLQKSYQKKYTLSTLGHSCEREVSEALYLAPTIVRTGKLEKGTIQEGGWRNLRPTSPVQGFYTYDEMTVNGCIGDATKANEAIGKEIVEEALDNLEQTLKELISMAVKANRNTYL